MPKVREGYRQVATQLPVDAWDALEVLAAANGRSVVEELTHAVRRHLAAPPVVRVVVEEPPLQSAEVGPEKVKPKAKRTRKKGDG
jgi:hypothetical protein